MPDKGYLDYSALSTTQEATELCNNHVGLVNKFGLLIFTIDPLCINMIL